MPPDDEALAALLGADLASVRRSPYAYATSWPLEEIEVDGERFILKHLDPSALTADARAAKRTAALDPAREIETYRRLLMPRGHGPRVVATSLDPAGPWLLMEKVPGVELWQIGDVDRWRHVMTWLAQLHASFAGDVAALLAANPHLIRYDDPVQRHAEAALAALGRSGDDRSAALGELVGQVTAALAPVAPDTLVHGELYPSNVLVGSDAAHGAVWPIDWETAGVGRGAMDLAALITGWDAAQRCDFVAAYAGAAGLDALDLRAEVDVWRLDHALGWIVRGEGWRPPPEHATDWIGEAIDAAEAWLA